MFVNNINNNVNAAPHYLLMKVIYRTSQVCEVEEFEKHEYVLFGVSDIAPFSRAASEPALSELVLLLLGKTVLKETSLGDPGNIAMSYFLIGFACLCLIDGVFMAIFLPRPQSLAQRVPRGVGNYDALANDDDAEVDEAENEQEIENGEVERDEGEAGGGVPVEVVVEPSRDRQSESLTLDAPDKVAEEGGAGGNPVGDGSHDKSS